MKNNLNNQDKPQKPQNFVLGIILIIIGIVLFFNFFVSFFISAFLGFKLTFFFNLPLNVSMILLCVAWILIAIGLRLIRNNKFKKTNKLENYNNNNENNNVEQDVVILGDNETLYVKKCLYCGAENKSTSKFCDACGKKFDVIVQENNNELQNKNEKELTKKVCPNCNWENEPTDKFCRNCGEKI